MSDRQSTMLDRREFLEAIFAGFPLLLMCCSSSQGEKAPEAPRGKVLLPEEEVRNDKGCPEIYEGDVKADHLFLALIDRTGSFWAGRRADTIRNEAARLARRLPPGSAVLGRFISDNSFSDTEIFLCDAVPQPPPMIGCENPFDEKCQKENKRREALGGCVEVARQHIADGILRLNPPRAERTDIWGAIAAASEILDIHRTAQRAIFIWSDLGDNVGTHLPAEPLPGFEDTRVVVTTAGTATPEALARRKAAFDRRLSGWRATVSFRPLGALASVDELLDRRVEGP